LQRYRRQRISRKCLHNYKKQRDYGKSARKVTGDRRNIRTVLAKLQETEGIQDRCFHRYRRQKEYLDSAYKI